MCHSSPLFHSTSCKRGIENRAVAIGDLHVFRQGQQQVTVVVCLREEQAYVDALSLSTEEIETYI